MKLFNSNKKKWIWNKLVPKILFFGMFGGVIIYGQWNQYLLRTYARYTIGTTINTYWTRASGKQLQYEYKTGNKLYRNSDHYNEKTKVPNGRYYVKFCSKDPDISEIIQYKAVPDSIVKAPNTGWENLP